MITIRGESIEEQSGILNYAFVMTTQTKESAKSRRLRERIGLKLPVRVYSRDSIDHEWTEMSRLIDVTPFGARLALRRPTELGRLLHLTMAMPRQLRCFDHVEDQYRIWALVRNLKLLDAARKKEGLIDIGVAFVGKRLPKSYESNPSQRFEIAKASTEGLWVVTEEAEELLMEINDVEKRKETRHSIPLEVLIEVFDEKGALSTSERSVTENISSQGTAVFTSLNISPGRFVKLTSERQGHSALAVIRDRRVAADGISRLHLEFVGSEWPL